MARPQNIHTYLENHNQIANDMVDVIQEKFKEGENQLVMPKFEQTLRLLTLECKYLLIVKLCVVK